jgi:hypothetical protein
VTSPNVSWLIAVEERTQGLAERLQMEDPGFGTAQILFLHSSMVTVGKYLSF